MTTAAARPVESYPPASAPYTGPETGQKARLELIPSQPERGFLDDEGLESIHQVHGSFRSPGGHGDLINYTVSATEACQGGLAHVINPGLFGIKLTYGKLVAELAQQGLMTVTFGPGRYGGDTYADLCDPQKLHADTLAAVMNHVVQDKRLTDLPGGENLNTTKAVIDSHSMGLRSAIRHAKAHPDEVAALQYISPVGLEGRSVGLRFASRLPALLRPTSPHALGQTERQLLFGLTNHCGHNPKRVIGEIVSCMLADHLTDVEQIHTAGTIKQALLVGGRDRLTLARPAVQRAGQYMDYYETIPEMDHFGPQRRAKLLAERLAFVSNHLLGPTV